MATEFFSELDRDFYKDNFLTDMDFNLADLRNEDHPEFDFSSPDYLNFDNLLGPLDSHTDFQYSMLHDDQRSDHSASSDYFTDIGDSSSPVKAEPASPCSSSSSSVTDSPKSKHQTGSSPSSSQVEIKVESSLTNVPCNKTTAYTVRPRTINIHPKSLPVPANSCQPLVLTADEFNKLKAQGILKPQLHSVKTEHNQFSETIPSLRRINKSLSEVELKALKRHERMLKNRESASLSRKKKKEYLLSLEQKLEEQAQINDKLKKENEQLKNQVKMLQTENNLLKKSPVSKIKKTTCFVLLLVFIGLNFSPLSIFNIQKKVAQPLPRPLSTLHTRTLLWDSATSDTAFIDNFNDTLDDLSDGIFDGITCPKSINKTESLRLADELTGWVMRHEKQLGSKKGKKQSTGKIFPLKRFKFPIPKNLNNLPKPKIQSDNKNIGQIQIFEWKDNPYENFMAALHRRDDTFYVVSFRGDHLLLPAMAHNKTQRPRMSLVMPAMPLNETMQPPPKHIAMMQIDCEVMDAKLVHLKESLIPEHLRENHTATQAHVMSSLVPQRHKASHQKKVHSAPPI